MHILKEIKLDREEPPVEREIYLNKVDGHGKWGDPFARHFHEDDRYKVIIDRYPPGDNYYSKDPRNRVPEGAIVEYEVYLRRHDFLFFAELLEVRTVLKTARRNR